MFSSPQASSAKKVRDDNSPAVVSMGNDDVASDARSRHSSDVPVFLSRVYVSMYVNMNTLRNWVTVCSKTQQISGNNRNLLPKNMVVGQNYLCNVAKAIFYHASVP